MKAIIPTRLRQSPQQLGYAWPTDGPSLIGSRTAFDVPAPASYLLIYYWQQLALPPGRFRDASQPGFHQHKLAHSTLVQIGGKVHAYRANETRALNEGYVGINIRRADAANATPRIASRSAGGQVFLRKNSPDELRPLCGRYRASCHNCCTRARLRERELA